MLWDKDSCCGRRVPEDRPARAGDALRGRALRRADRPTPDERIDLSRIPFDDQATYETIQGAETTGVFQIESRAQMGSLRRTRPRDLKDLTIQVALVRPGPIVGGAVNPYIERRQGALANPDFQSRTCTHRCRSRSARHWGRSSFRTR